MADNNNRCRSFRIRRSVPTIGRGSLWLIIAVIGVGCVRYRYQPEPVEPESILQSLLARHLQEPGLLAFLAAQGRETADWPPAAWDPETLTLIAYYFNPRLRAARAEVELRHAEIATAGQRTNPGLDLPAEHHSDTSGDRSPWLIGLVLDLRLERSAKRAARVEWARAQANRAWIDLEAAAWDLRSQLQRALIDYYGAMQSSALIDDELVASEQIAALMQRREELGEVSSFEANRAMLELQRLRLQRARQAASLQERYSIVVALTGLPAAEFTDSRFTIGSLEQTPAAQRVEQLTNQRSGLTHRFDIRQALADYAAAEALLKLEIERQYPDIALAPGFVFDQEDEIWTLGSSWVLPVFHNNDGAIREALARRKLEQARILNLQSEIINDIQRRRSFYLLQQRALAEAAAVVDELERREGQLDRQFELGHADRLAVLQARIGTIRARRDAFALQLETMRATQALEGAIQRPLDSTIDIAGPIHQLFAAEHSGSATK